MAAGFFAYAKMVLEISLGEISPRNPLINSIWKGIGPLLYLEMRISHKVNQLHFFSPENFLRQEY